jgi:hypothetical protein
LSTLRHFLRRKACFAFYRTQTKKQLVDRRFRIDLMEGGLDNSSGTGRHAVIAEDSPVIDDYNVIADEFSDREVLLQLRRNMEKIVLVVNDLRAAVSAIPDIQNSVSQVREVVEELLSYTKSIVMASGSSAPKEGELRDEKIAKQLLPVKRIFTPEFVIRATASTIPRFIHQHAVDLNLRDNTDGPEYILSSILYSSKASERKQVKSSKVACLQAEFKSLVAKVLVVNSKIRAPSVSMRAAIKSAGGPSVSLSASVPSQSGSFSFDRSEEDMVRPVASPPVVVVEADWMQGGYIRSEIYDEMRRGFDGGEAVKECTPSLAKKRKLDPEAEFRDEVSRAVLKKVYPLINSLCRQVRFQVKKVFFDHIGCIICENAKPRLDFEEVCPLQNIKEVELTYPRNPGADAGDDDKMNSKLLADGTSGWKEFHFSVSYTVTVEDGNSKETKVLQRPLNLFSCALNFCIALSQTVNREKFLRSSTYALRMVYVVAIAFRNLVVDLHVLYPSRNLSTGKKEWEDLLLRWHVFMPGADCLKKLQHKGLVIMDINKYNEVNVVNDDESAGSGAFSEDEDGDNVVEREVEDIFVPI